MANSVEWIGAAWGVLTGLSIGFLVLLGWRARQRADMARSAPTAPAQKLPRHTDVALMTFESRELDVEQEVSAVLAEFEATARHHRVDVQVAVQPKLMMWADPCALRQMLLGVLTQTIERAEGGAALVSASWHGGRVQLTVMDDGPAGDHATLIGQLREVEQCAALQGGTLEVQCRKLSGNSVVIRMPGTGDPGAVPSHDEELGETPARGTRWTGAIGAS
jgi:hypothetical protein